MADDIGRLAKLYYNSGTYTSITAAEIVKIGDVDFDMGMSTNEVDTRESPNTKTIRGNKQFKLSFTYYPDSGITDAVLTALQASYFAQSNMDIFVMAGPIATAGTKGFRGPFGVVKFDRKEPVNEKIMIEIEMEEVIEFNSSTMLSLVEYTVPTP